MHADQLPWIRRYGRTLAISVAVVALTMPAASSQANASVAQAARVTPSPSATGTPSPSASATPSPSAAVTPSPSAAVTPSPSAAATPSPSASVTPSPAATASAGARAGPGTKQVSYQGYTFDVPRTWPVISLAQQPNTCVQFDRQVVYLGTPGANQDCPSLLIGTTEALLVAPGAGTAGPSSVEDPVAQQITVVAPRIQITATFDTDPGLIYRILASASLPAPTISVPNPAASQAADGPQFPRVDPPALPANVANFTGRGFDTCAAPSKSYMRAWRRHSRYRAIGIYIGGSNRACFQRNLSARWIRTEAAHGWRFFPMYVGPQAEFRQLRKPVRDGRRAANDAVVQARRLGFGPRTPIYYDMEAYPVHRTGEVLRFLTSWTKRLHRLGYKSGAYSSSGSGIVDLARAYRNHRYKMPNVIFDALWNGSRNTRDRALRKGEWDGHRRMHQYAGNVTQTFGGDTINIDKDFLNVRLPTPGGAHQSSRAAAQPDGTVDVFYRGTNHKLWHAGPLSKAAAGGVASADLGRKTAAQPTAVSPVPGALDVFYEGAGRRLWEVSRRAGRGWSAPRMISRMGRLGSPPAAVAQPNGVIDVFWKGSDGDQLWHGQYSPGKGWKGPQDLRGRLASGPAPVESSPGTVQVFWKGKNGALWHVIRRPGRNWTRPRSLGMGQLGGAPQATARATGAIDVFWRGSGNNRLWSAAFRPGHRWAGPLSLHGHLASIPFPLLSAGGRVHVFWKGTDHQLWQVSRGPKTGWGRPYRLRMGRLRAGPFGAIGPGGKSEVFWRGKAGHLWFAEQASGSSWIGPRNLGGHVA